MSDFDLIVRNGTVVDGSGGAPQRADVAVKAGKIAAVGKITGSAREEIDARDKLVTPGFVDIHTHYDGQATWENTLAPSSNHGVTTIVGGNCGVGFAPCRRADQEALVAVMEGVEDIPQAVMADGIPWEWETFPEYLDFLGQRAFDIDVAMQIPHSPIRVYVMGERGINHEPSTDADREQMSRLVEQSVRSGAIGVSTSRSLSHRAKNGNPAPSVRTSLQEVLALADGLRAAQAGVFQIVTEFGADPSGEIALVDQIAQRCGRPTSFTMLEVPYSPTDWRQMLTGVEKANAGGRQVRAQIAPRPVGILMGLELSLNPIVQKPSYAKIAQLPLAERVKILRDPEFRARVLAETSVPDPQPLFNMVMEWIDKIVPLGEPPDYFPAPQAQLGARAAREGTTAHALAYDLMLENDGKAILYMPSANFATRSNGPVYEMLRHPNTVIGLGDGGAHYGFICDAGYTSFVLSYWARDAQAERRFPIEWAVHALTRRPAQTVGLLDRGLIAPGLKADLNVIDHDHLTLHQPVPHYDLPSGGRRLWQRADGYDATIVSGTVTFRNGTATGARPGRLVRGPGYSPRARAA